VMPCFPAGRGSSVQACMNDRGREQTRHPDNFVIAHKAQTSGSAFAH
jgi:hypothetical protein